MDAGDPTRRVLGGVEQALAERDFAQADQVLRSFVARSDDPGRFDVVRRVRQQAYGAFERTVREDYFAEDAQLGAWSGAFGSHVAKGIEAGRMLHGIVPDPPEKDDLAGRSLWEVWELLIARGWSEDREPGFFEGVATMTAYALEADGRFDATGLA